MSDSLRRASTRRERLPTLERLMQVASAQVAVASRRVLKYLGRREGRGARAHDAPDSRRQRLHHPVPAREADSGMPLVMPIYEGTSQIQALMAMKDTLDGNRQEPTGVRSTHGAGALAFVVEPRFHWKSRVAQLQSLSLWRATAPRAQDGRRQGEGASRASRLVSGPTNSPKTGTQSAISPLRCFMRSD